MPYTTTAYPTTPKPPQFTPGMFNTPHDDIAGMREMLSKGLDFGGQYANYLTAVETDRHNQGLDTLQRGAAAFDKPSMTDQDIRRLFSGQADSAAAQFRQNMGALREALGQKGVTGGGFGAGLATKFAAMANASQTDATRSLYERRIQSDMMDRAAKWAATQDVASAQMADPSIVGLDWLNNALSAGLTGAGIEQQDEAARRSAKASKKAGKMQGIGQIAGAGISAL